MKKTYLLSITLMIIVAVSLSACKTATPYPDVDPASQTQVAIFAQATLTKYAEMQPTQEPAEVETPMPTFTLIPEESEVPGEESTEAPAEVTEAPTEAPTDAPTAEPTVVPTAIPQPTSPADLPQPPSGHTRISFDTGTTNKTVTDTVEANQTKRYVLWMAKWQIMDISTSADNAAYISVKTPSGKVLVGFPNRWIWYRDFAQESGDYVIEVSGMAYKSNFNLKVSVPQILQFEKGASSLKALATVPANGSHEFSAWANQGQTMRLNLNNSEKFILSVMHADGTEVLRYDAKLASAEFVLPKAGTYIIKVHNISSEALSVELSLEVK